jgi:hypothetical protein
MDAKTIAAGLQAAVMAGIGIRLGLRGYYRRRAYWSRSSWFGLGLALGAGLALIGFSLFVSAAVDRHVAWIGAPHSNTRNWWVIGTLASLTAGVAAVGGTLVWFARGWPRRPFPFARRPARRLAFGVASVLPESTLESLQPNRSLLLARHDRTDM